MAGYREFQTGEVLTAANVNNFLMNQAVMVFADDAARDTALSGVITEGMLTYNLDAQRLEVYDGTEWKVVGVAEINPISATGGNVFEVVSGSVVYNVHKFTTGTDFVVTDGSQKVEVLIVGGGGGGGGTSSVRDRGASSGGGGGVLRFFEDVTAGTYAVAVGAGGAGGAPGDSNGASGGDSSAFGETAFGGGFGSRTDEADTPRLGGSGGNGGGSRFTAAAALGTPGQGHPGHISRGREGGAGGSSGGVRAWISGDSGPGLLYDLDGLVREYGKGANSTARRLEDNTTVFNGQNIAPNTGLGGVGASSGGGVNRAGGSGADGVVIIRYPVRFV